MKLYIFILEHFLFWFKEVDIEAAGPDHSIRVDFTWLNRLNNYWQIGINNKSKWWLIAYPGKFSETLTLLYHQNHFVIPLILYHLHHWNFWKIHHRIYGAYLTTKSFKMHKHKNVNNNSNGNCCYCYNIVSILFVFKLFNYLLICNNYLKITSDK